LEIGGRPDGARSLDDQVLATYVHGIFDDPDACVALLAWAGLDGALRIDCRELRERSIDRVADTIAANTDLGALFGRMLRAAKASPRSR
jgi:adenosylcobyric acid synthase